MQDQSLRSVVSSFFFQMILFLQGASHAGKTTFARHLARLTGASVMSLDLLKMGLIKSGNTDFSGLTPEDDAAIAERLWPIVREMALVADENGQSLIVEGVSLPFGEAGGLARELGEGRVAAFAVVFSEKYIRNHYELICQKASASECRVHQDSIALVRPFGNADGARACSLSASAFRKPSRLRNSYGNTDCRYLVSA